MKARIRYKDYKHGIKISTNAFETTNHGQVKVTIAPELGTFGVIKRETQDLVLEGQVDSGKSHELKKTVKAKLRELGVQFAPERRMRGAKELLDLVQGE
jgi:hypothetical protein